MSELNQSYPGILLAYLNGTHYTLDNSDCNELSKLFQRVEEDCDDLSLCKIELGEIRRHKPRHNVSRGIHE